MPKSRKRSWNWSNPWIRRGGFKTRAQKEADRALEREKATIAAENEAKKAKIEADRETEKAKIEAEKMRAENERLKIEADIEAEKAKIEAEKEIEIAKISAHGESETEAGRDEIESKRHEIENQLQVRRTQKNQKYKSVPVAARVALNMEELMVA